MGAGLAQTSSPVVGWGSDWNVTLPLEHNRKGLVELLEGWMSKIPRPNQAHGKDSYDHPRVQEKGAAPCLACHEPAIPDPTHSVITDEEVPEEVQQLLCWAPSKGSAASQPEPRPSQWPSRPSEIQLSHFSSHSLKLHPPSLLTPLSYIPNLPLFLLNFFSIVIF